MTEKYYIVVSNLAKLRVINAIASSLMPVSKADKGANTEILDQCYQWITRLETEVEGIMNSSGAPAMVLEAVVVLDRWSGHGEGGTIARVVIKGGDYGLYESTPAQIEQARKDAETVNAALRSALNTSPER
jgi:hypothetical protein